MAVVAGQAPAGDPHDGWVAGRTVTRSRPGAATAAVVPSTASGTVMCRSCYRSARTGEARIGLGADDHVNVAGRDAGRPGGWAFPCQGAAARLSSGCGL